MSSGLSWRGRAGSVLRGAGKVAREPPRLAEACGRGREDARRRPLSPAPPAGALARVSSLRHLPRLRVMGFGRWDGLESVPGVGFIPPINSLALDGAANTARAKPKH